MPHADVLRHLTGVEEEGWHRVISIYHSSDFAVIATPARSWAARASRSACSRKGTTVIQSAGLPRLDNLELFRIAQLCARDLPRDRAQRRALRQGRPGEPGAGAC